MYQVAGSMLGTKVKREIVLVHLKLEFTRKDDYSVSNYQEDPFPKGPVQELQESTPAGGVMALTAQTSQKQRSLVSWFL